MSDSELLDRLLAGEQKAYRELVARYQGAMRAVAYAIVGSRHADEVVQDAWLAVVRSLSGFEGRASLKTWLLTITANTAKTRLKQNRRDLIGKVYRFMISQGAKLDHKLLEDSKKVIDQEATGIVSEAVLGGP